MTTPQTQSTRLTWWQEWGIGLAFGFAILVWFAVWAWREFRKP